MFWGSGLVVLSEKRMIKHDIKFGCSGCDGGAGFPQLRVRVLCAFVEADDAGYDDGGALEVGYAALDPVETDADGLVGWSADVSRLCKI
jgi:hypothetical protein